MPQYRILFNDKDRLTEALQLVYYSLGNLYTAVDKCKEGCSMYKELVESLFEVKLSNEEFEVFAQDDVWELLEDGFLVKRLDDIQKPLEVVLEEVKASKLKEEENEFKALNKQLKKKNNNKGSQKVLTEKKTFHTFEIKRNEERFIPEYKGEGNLLYGNQWVYSFVRHLHCLYERLQVAYDFIIPAFEQELERMPEINIKYGALIKANMKELKTERYYKIFIRGVVSNILGEIDTVAYEELCKWLIGSRAYLLLTIEKLIRSVYFMLKFRLRKYFRICLMIIVQRMY